MQQTLSMTAVLEVKQQGTADICIRQDQRLFATAGWDGKIRVFHHKKRKPLATLQVCPMLWMQTRLQLCLMLLIDLAQQSRLGHWKVA